MRRFVLELSERFCMSASRLGVEMSGLEFRERMVLEKLRQSERERAAEKAKARR